MHVKMNATISGTRDGEDWPAKGSIVDLPEQEARDLIFAGLAIEVDTAAPETATVEPAETATTTSKRPSRAAKKG